MAVHLPPTYLQCPGEPAIPFSTWILMFENYLLATHVEGDDWPDTRKHATLLHCPGTEAQRIFYTLPNSGTTYSPGLAALMARFISKVNIIAERHKHRQREQRNDENILQYVARSVIWWTM